MKLKFIFTLFLLLPLANAAIIDDFEDGFFLDNSPVQWVCPAVGDYHCNYQIDSVIKRNGNYSVRIGAATNQPSKFATEINFQENTWYGAWMLESNNSLDHSMLELFVDNAVDAATVIRNYEKGTGINKFKVYSQNGYLTMDGPCPDQIENQWYFLRIKRNLDLTYSAEVYNNSGELSCYKYNYPAHVSGTPTKLRILGDQAVPYTYWDDITVGDEISGITQEVCNNNIIEGQEVCDGTDTGTTTCQSLGYDSGTIACSSDCQNFNTSGCFSNPAGDNNYLLNTSFCFDKNFYIQAPSGQQASSILSNILNYFGLNYIINYFQQV